MKKTPSFGAVAAAAMGWETHAFQLRYTSNRVLEVAAILKTQEEAAALIAALSLVGSLLPRPLPAELSTPSARSDIPQDPVFISELSAAGEKSGAVGDEKSTLDQLADLVKFAAIKGYLSHEIQQTVKVALYQGRSK